MQDEYLNPIQTMSVATKNSHNFFLSLGMLNAMSLHAHSTEIQGP